MEDAKKQLIYLSKLALRSKTGLPDIDPFSVLNEVFSFATAQEMKTLLYNAGQAAIHEKYNWKEGSPGNLLFFYERLELLVEASVLIVLIPKHHKTAQRNVKTKPGSVPNLPCTLSDSEWANPLSVLEGFFTYQSIKKWKQQIQVWMEAGLSNYSVLEELKPGLCLPYYTWLNRLFDACWRLQR